MANRVVELLSRIYKTAEDRELIPEGSNPCQEIGKYRQRRHERFLTDEEFRRLGRLLDEAEGSDDVPVHAVMAIRLLLLTGCRKNEILNLRWDHVDLEAKEMQLAEAKTGPRTVQLSPAAAAVLARVPADRRQSVRYCGQAQGDAPGPISIGYWDAIRKRAGLEDVRLHDCRHSFASRALALGESLPMIDRLLGHSQVETTARYAHLARDSIREAAAEISSSIEADLWRDCPDPPATD